MEIKEIGSKQNALETYAKMAEASPAYGALIKKTAQNKKKENLEWDDIPILTKKNFYSAYPWREIVPRNLYKDIYSILRSSGTTAPDGSSKGFFWPQLKSQDAYAVLQTHEAMTSLLELDKKSTLVIIGLSLGSWAGGEQFSFMFKSLAIKSKFPLVVFSPGNQHTEILELVEKCQQEFGQIIIALCPSAIFYLQRLASKSGVVLPQEKILYLVTGEPFPEEMRLAQKLSMISVYGSADTGMIGVESPLLIRVRQYLSTTPGAAKAFGFPTTSIPNLYHINAQRSYLERVNGELVITQWQGLPLVRYNLEDKVMFFDWSQLCQSLAQFDSKQAAVWTAYSKIPLPPVVAVFGRSQGCLFLCGSNIFESMLQETFMQSSIWKSSSGAFVVWTEVSNGQQVMCWQIELKPGALPPQGQALDLLYAEMVDLLSKQQPEFAEDYEKFYKPFESDGLKVFRFHFSQAGGLSEHPQYQTGIKKKVIIDSGPLA